MFNGEPVPHLDLKCLCNSGGLSGLCFTALWARRKSNSTSKTAATLSKSRDQLSQQNSWQKSCLDPQCVLVQVTCLSTASSSATTLPTLPVGSAFRWLKTCATFFVLFLSVSKLRISVSIDHVPGMELRLSLWDLRPQSKNVP